MAGLGAHGPQTPMPVHTAVTGFSLPVSVRMSVCVCFIERCLCVCVCVASAFCGDLGTGRGWPSSLGELHEPGPSCLWSNHRTPIWEHCCRFGSIAAAAGLELRASNTARLATGLEPKLKGAAEIINSHIPSDSSVLPGAGNHSTSPFPSSSPASFGEGGRGLEGAGTCQKGCFKHTGVHLLNDTRVLGCREHGVCAKRPCQLGP